MMQSTNKQKEICLVCINHQIIRMSESEKVEVGIERRKKMIGSLKEQMKEKLKGIKKSYIEPVQNLIDGPESQENNEIRQSGTKKVQTFEQFNQIYQLKYKIGEGRSGIVYKAWNKQKQKFYAVKMIRFQLQHIFYLKQSFYNIAQLNHKNIINYRSIFINARKKQAYLVTELFQHPPLQEFIHKLTQNQIQSITHDILDGLSYLHRKGICHRDIKPDNILYDEKQNQIKIIDFGVCKKFKMVRYQREMITCTGTQLFKAPEMIAGGVYNELIDVWATGVLIYNLITGTTPFYSEYISKINQNILKGEIQFDSQIWSKYSPLAQDLIRRMLKPSNVRISAESAKKHLWLHGHENEVKSIEMKKPSINKLQLGKSLSIPTSEMSFAKVLKNGSLSQLEQQMYVDPQKWIDSEEECELTIESPFPSQE